ncbi:glycosyltransferase [Phaeobacter sp. J2-8]|uniref:glycosyltransferase family 2 protein n=1 Tax=Phaeobacter sp. J2-8 TaxID=2931394 RepID=UPI001FD5977C|nr:glycosyltransferase [Phaeobacter sp. J2-8]MCJ7871241.1 glycosyltransferase [Phaeobacter sp. J2-8]
MATVSVIIVSHGRPRALKRCLLAVRQLLYPEFEIVVVADGGGLRAIHGTPQSSAIKSVQFDEENISAARNIGIGLAAGEVVAFIDDDAVPEPTWLTHLVSAFDDTEVAAAGGYVRGRNGVSWQWRAAWVDAAGARHPLTLPDDRPVVLHPKPGRAIKTEGTNMAFRREVIAGIGGFDPAFRFFLDETDVNLRLARGGHAAAIVPLAEVHHGFAASARRRDDRVPRDLFEIGASHAAFLLRHCPVNERPAQAAAFTDEQRRRLLRHLVAGRLEPRDVRHLLQRLAQGMAEGRTRAPSALPALPRSSAAFLPIKRSAVPQSRIHYGRWRIRTKIRQKAAHDVAAGHIATVMIFSFSALFGRVLFTESGFWEHSGGQFGQMKRQGKLFQIRRFAGKCQNETNRVRAVRGLSRP